MLGPTPDSVGDSPRARYRYSGRASRANCRGDGAPVFGRQGRNTRPYRPAAEACHFAAHRQTIQKDSPKLTAPDGKVHKIEVLGDGQQLAVAGVHPDTQGLMSGRAVSLRSTLRAIELPLVDDDEIRTILDLCTDELKTKLGWGEADAAPTADTNGHDATPRNCDFRAH